MKTASTIGEGQPGAKEMTKLIACFCFDLRLIGTGYATRALPAAGRKGHYCPRSMWRGNAHGKWHLRENSRSPCRQQVRSRSDLLDHKPTARLTAFGTKRTFQLFSRM